MRRLFALVLIGLTASGSPLPTQDLPIISPVTAEQPPVPGDSLAFGDAQSRMTVPVSIGIHGPYDFVIDTGAERSVVSRDLAGLLSLRSGPDVRVTAMTGTGTVGTVVVPSLQISRIISGSIDAPELEWRNLGAPGMLGIDALQGHSVSIDFDRGQMTVSPSQHRSIDPPQPGEIVVHAKNRYGQLIVTDASYHGHPIAVVVDTGSPITIGNLALRRKLERAPKPIGRVTLISALGGLLVADYVEIDRLKIGNVGFEHVPIAFADVEPFKRFELLDQPALLLGMDALRLFHNVDIDFANREVRFTLPTRRSYDPT